MCFVFFFPIGFFATRLLLEVGAGIRAQPEASSPYPFPLIARRISLNLTSKNLLLPLFPLFPLSPLSLFVYLKGGAHPFLEILANRLFFQSPRARLRLTIDEYPFSVLAFVL